MNVRRFVTYQKHLITVPWAEKNVYFSSRIPTSEPGQFSRAKIPAWCVRGGPLEALDDNTVETVVVMKGAQVCATTTGAVWLSRCTVNDPGPALVVMFSANDSKEKCGETWTPIWEDSPHLRPFIPANRKRDWTRAHQIIKGQRVDWIGANSPGRLGAKPKRYLYLDEVDKYPLHTQREAGAAALARQRVKAYRKKGLAKIFEPSTPTTEEGEIYQEFLMGDQRKLFVPCHACGHSHVMTWQNFKLDMTAPPAACIAGAHYECPDCRRAWSDHDRWRAIAAGEWRPTAFGNAHKDPRCRSFHMPSWTSLFVTTTYLASKWLRAQQSQSELQDFINGECGEPYQHFDAVLTDAAFVPLEGAYSEGQIWTELEPYRAQVAEMAAATIIGCDVQKSHLVAVVRRFAENGDSGMIWAGELRSLPELDALAEKHSAAWVMIDRRFRQREVDEWAYDHEGTIPCQGVVRRGRQLFALSEIDLDEGRRSGVGRKIGILGYDADQLKDMLYQQIERLTHSRRWMIPRGYAARKDYTTQMTAERSVNGRWQNPTQKPNHFWDAECLALLGAIKLGAWPMNTTEETTDASEHAAAPAN